MVKTYISIIILILWFFSCSKPVGEEYFPLSLGRKWEYSIEYSTDTDIVSVKKLILKARVDKIESILGKKFFKVVQIYKGIPGSEPVNLYYRKSKEGIYMTYKNEKEFLIVPFPLKVGRKLVFQGPQGEVNLNVEGIQDVEFIDRLYKNCIKITYKWKDDSGTWEQYVFLAKNIGMVRQITKYNGVTTEYKLQNYEK